ncbi:TonB-dependent receptor domain-containing protein [Saccharicrinis sp. FJH54]|uniref:TonB-dependent receptor domain-containing protein n=1 Tax=Saccharicrinis sp. FJH54 TaxID=3344665 RepID=UPI0035D4DE37
MRYKLLLLLISMIGFQLNTYSQPTPVMTGEDSEGILTGKIVDESNNQPIEYANVAIYNKDGELVTGGITDNNGHFSIRDLDPGEYYIEVKFIGFDETRIDNFEITSKSRRFNTGIIRLTPSVSNLESVDVVAEKKAIQYKIDKKIVNPSQYLTSAGGSAVDILANTPSITVDVEGNVTLRGSSNFTVLIDGKPTPFEATDALEQVPASQIENIEIITNPSVKYDPDGTAGIINIITKKSKLKGLNGIINMDANSLGSIGGDFLLNFQRPNYSFYVGGSRSDRQHKGHFEGLTETYKDDTTFFNSQIGDGGRGFSSNNLKTGFTINPDTTSSLQLNLNGGLNNRKFSNDVDYITWEMANGAEFNRETSMSTSLNKGNGQYVSGDLTYDKKFKGEGHKLISTFFYQYEKSDEENVNEQVNGSTFINGLKSWEVGDGTEMRFKTDYTLPITTQLSLEAGYQWRYDKEYEWYDRVDYQQAGFTYDPGPQSLEYKTTDFFRQIHSIYATLGGELGRFGYKLGLRGEYTDRSIDFNYYNAQAVFADSSFTINRWDLFPSIHFSYALPADFQVMASYSKRIERPRSWYMEPFETWVNAYNVRQGNPNIQPEYIDSYELGFQKSFKKGFFSLEGFYRMTENRIDRIQSVYVNPVTRDTATNIILMKTENSGKDFALGVEGMLNYEFTNWYSLNLNGSLFNYKIETSIDGAPLVRESQNWGLRMSNTFKPFKNNRIQFDVMYRSPSVSAQGERDGFAFTNLAVRQDFMKRKLSVTLSVNDLLNTAKFHMRSSGTNFKSERTWDMQSPVVQLQLSYKLNNFMPDKKQNQQQENGGGMDMDNSF